MNQTKGERVKRLIFLLLSQGVASSQEEVATKLGYTPIYLTHIVTGKKPVTGKFIERLRNLSDKISTDYILYGKGEMLLQSAPVLMPEQVGVLSQKIEKNDGLVVGNAEMTRDGNNSTSALKAQNQVLERLVTTLQEHNKYLQTALDKAMNR
jgi:transcriptional regulator with XRE-family HTH domain